MKKDRIIGLDLLRGISILLVIGVHGNQPLNDVVVNPYILSFLDKWKFTGWIGVDLFFVLSGFLVTSLIFNEYKLNKSVNLKRFYIRRGFKIYPAFYTLIAFTVLKNALKGDVIEYGRLLSELFFFQSYVQGLWYHTWSIGVEEHFYIILGLLVTVLMKLNTKNPFKLVPKIPIILGLLVLSMRLYLSYFVPYDTATHFFPTHLRIDSFFVGAALAYYYVFEFESLKTFIRKHCKILGLISLILISPIFLVTTENSPFITTIGLTMLSWGFGIVIALILFKYKKTRKSASRPVKFLSYIGVHSYSIYLWHWQGKYFALNIFRKLNIDDVNTYYYGTALYVVLGIALGIFMSKIVEIPAIKLRDRFFPSNLKPIAPEVVNKLEIVKTIDSDLKEAA